MGHEGCQRKGTKGPKNIRPPSGVAKKWHGQPIPILRMRSLAPAGGGAGVLAPLGRQRSLRGSLVRFMPAARSLQGSLPLFFFFF